MKYTRTVTVEAVKIKDDKESIKNVLKLPGVDTVNVSWQLKSTKATVSITMVDGRNLIANFNDVVYVEDGAIKVVTPQAFGRMFKKANKKEC